MKQNDRCGIPHNEDLTGIASRPSIAIDQDGVGYLTSTLCDFVADFSNDRIPRDVSDHVRFLLLDNIGCAIGGSGLLPALLLREHLAEISGEGDATIFGTDGRLPSVHAAYANSYAACLLSFDDSHVHLGHLGSVIIPGALAIAERFNLTGREMITAVTVGYEVALRIGDSIRPSPERAKEVLGFATWQIFGTVAAAASLRGFSPVQVADAFGLAMTGAPVPFLRKFSGHPLGWLKNNLGWATLGGLTAVSLVSRGFVGNRTVFDGPDGFWIMAGSDRFDPQKLLSGLGEHFRVHEVGFKPYACCQWAHSSIDALRSLVETHSIAPDEIGHVHVEVAEDFVSSLDGPFPTNFLEAEFHLPFLLSRELTGRSSASGFGEADLSDPAILQLASRISVGRLSHGSESFHRHGHLPARVTIRYKDGVERQCEVAIPTGAAGGPEFGQAAVADKFVRLASPVLGKDRAMTLMDRVLNIDEDSMDIVFQAIRDRS